MHLFNTLIFIIVETFPIFTLLLIETVHFACGTPGVVREFVVSSNSLLKHLLKDDRVCLPWRKPVSLTSRIWRTIVYNEPATKPTHKESGPSFLLKVIPGESDHY